MNRKDDNIQMNSKIVIFFSTVLLGLLIGCQESLEEINQPVGNQSFDAQSELATLIRKSTLNDGSVDNILDNSSSFSVKLPIQVLANQSELTISSENDFQQLVSIFKQERFLRDSVQLIFPATIILPDYSEMIIKDQAMFNQIMSQSIEGGADDDIECFNFIYPIQLSFYDTQNQKAGTESIYNDQKMNQFISDLKSGALVSFSFPIYIESNISTDQILIQNNSELLSIFDGAINDCDEQDEKYYRDSDFNYSTGKLNILLTDAPFPTDLITETQITISQVELKLAGQPKKDTFLIVSENESTINVLELNNGITANLMNMQIPEGAYDQIKIKIKTASVLLNDGRIFDLKVPSGHESGIKILIDQPILIDTDVENTILLDFDISRSFVIQGNASSINGILFTPVIKASNLNKSGSIYGKIVNSLTDKSIKGAQVAIYATDTLNTTTFTNPSGNYKIIGLKPGKYKIIVESKGYQKEELDDINIKNGDDIDVNITLSPNN